MCAMLDNNPQFNVVTQAFPHIGVKIKEYWGQASFVPYMEGLLHGTREGTRRGFQADVLMALHHLAEQHKAAYPNYVVSDDFWAYVETKPTMPAL
ncbi:MAG: hypothetical protein BWK72_05005 [Rhodoferax ferrireducens]|uniref:Uncharacterized protein n=1 Tax=Rhodoferax ferrireducens TaxID=192843 RepID=A0A1W9KXC3_9BURK|nr:MAG: hypothetical protein BWK72_05005 [Rhodoferax ferrireducens]